MTIKKYYQCRLCSDNVGSNSILDFGSQPVANKFLFSTETVSQRYDLTIGQCERCGLMQLLQYPPIEAITPTYPWIAYNEPSHHLDAIAIELSNLLTEDSVIYGIGPFDRLLLERLLTPNLKLNQFELMSHVKKSPSLFPYLEEYQRVISREVLYNEIGKSGKAKLVIFRYLLEHSNDPIATLKALSCLLDDDGYLYIEIPDSSKFIDNCDYSFIWEEHYCYFTDSTFRRLAAYAGLKVQSMYRFSGALEDALVYFLQVSNVDKNRAIPITKRELETFEDYSFNFNLIKHSYQLKLRVLVDSGSKIAIFGAGHQSISFINLLGLAPYIDCVVDDDESKGGMYLPGSNLPIVNSDQLLGRSKVNICLLGVSPAAEGRVMAKLDRKSTRLNSSH